MASPKLSFRLPEETYKMLLKLAEVEKKTITELARDLIETGLGKRSTIEQDLLDEMRMMRIETGELIARAVKAGGHAAYYSKLACEASEETAHYITTNPELKGGQVLDAESKQQRSTSRAKKKKDIANHYLTEPFEKI
jgi:predicted DNA-binding protein